MRRGAEARKDDAVLGVIEDVFKPRPNGAFAFCVSGPVDIGRVRHKQQNTTPAVFGEGMQVEQLIVCRSRINLEVSGMDDDTKRGGDREGDSLNNRMRYVNELDGERSEFHLLPRLDTIESGGREQIVLFETTLNERECERRSVDSNVRNDGQQKRNCTYMVLVAMCEDQTSYMLAVFFEVGKVRRYDIDAQ